MIKIEHINLTVRDLEESVRLFKVLWPNADIRHRGEVKGGMSGDFEWLHLGNDDTYIALQAAPEKKEFYENPHVRDFYMHIGIEVKNLEDKLGTLRDLGYNPVVQDDVKERSRAYFLDKSGHYFELVEYLSNEADLKNQYV